MTDPAPEAAGPSPLERWNRLLVEPGGHVLRNKLGLTDGQQLRAAEYRIRAMRQGEIQRGEVDIPRTSDMAQLQAIHHHLFQDVYEWAGQPRDVDLVKDGQPFVEHGWAPQWIERTGSVMRGVDWPNISREDFVRTAATAYAELNLAHPFREGNGASTKLFLQQMTEGAPYRIDYDRVEKNAWNQASMDSRVQSLQTQTVQPGALVQVFDQIVVDREPPAAPAIDPQLAKVMELQNTTYRSAGGPTTERSASTAEQSAVVPTGARAQTATRGTERQV
ncbi:Fic/DOC family protein [Kribbella sp. CA-253562]|uniref:Fic/DOC family protein n=1 Tax=Kribbella sp. CA-253562 TaxID=3239942 RepID=UPI003D8D3911